MPRRRKRCWVESLPEVNYFKPAGFPLRELEEVVLTVEELEAVRLKDLVGLDQEQCAERMGVARTTFQRILYAARSKVADALVNGKVLKVEGGEYQLPAGRVFKCASCEHEFEVPIGAGESGEEPVCPKCRKGPVQRIGGKGQCCRRGRGYDCVGREDPGENPLG